jgi:hypothetical protein
MQDAEPDALEQTIHAHVAQFGWHVQFVAPTANDGRPPWAYTIGVYHSFGHPELTLSGVDLPDAHKTLNALIAQVQAGTPVISARGYTELFADGVGVRFFETDPRWYPEFFGRAIDFYGGTSFPILQGIWSDAAGRFPVSMGCRLRPAAGGAAGLPLRPGGVPTRVGRPRSVRTSLKCKPRAPRPDQTRHEETIAPAGSLRT